MLCETPPLLSYTNTQDPECEIRRRQLALLTDPAYGLVDHLKSVSAVPTAPCTWQGEGSEVLVLVLFGKCLFTLREMTL